MSIPKRHHYLPQFYLRGFCPAGDLWMYDREKGEIRRRNPKTVAVQKGFYAVRGPEGELDYAEVEKRLGVVETQAAPVIRKLDAGGALELKERYALAMFVALLKYRTTAFERQSAELQEVLSDSEAAKEMLAPSVEGVKTVLKQMGYGDAGLQEMAQRIYDHVREHGIEHRPGPNTRLDQILQGAYEVGTQLVLGPLTVALAPEGSGFNTSDDPFALVARAGAQDPRAWEGTEVVPPGYEGWIPLSWRCLLIAGHEELGGRYIRFDESDVEAANVMMAAQCERFFMGGDEVQLNRVAAELRRMTENGWVLPGRVDLSRHHASQSGGAD